MEIDKRKYSSLYRRKLVNKISKLKDKREFVNIFNIVQSELGKNMSFNRNGIFFNINTLSDECIKNLDDYLSNLIDNATITETEGKIKYKPYTVDELENINQVGPKLSNIEKSLLKKMNQTK